MKILSVLAGVLMPLMALAQNNFSLNLKTSGISDKAKMYLVFEANGNQQVENAVKENDGFTLNFKLNEPSVAVLILDHDGNKSMEEAFKQDAFRLFIEPSKLNAIAKDSIKNTILNSSINNDYIQYNNYTLPFDKQLFALNQEFQLLSEEQKNNESYISSLQEKYSNITEQRKIIIAQFIKDFPTSFVSLYMLNAELGGYNLNYEIAHPLFNNLSDNLKKTSLGKYFAIELDKGKYTSIGSMAPDFTEKSPEGKDIKLSDFKGKYVLLDFWASWCGPCRQENPSVVNAYQKYKDKNFTVLGVSLDKAKAPWVKAIADDKLAWQHVSDLNYFNGKLARLYGIEGIPQNFLINPEGKIVAKNLRGIALELKLKEIFKL